MKVNIIVQRFHPQIVGGAEYHSYLLAKALKARGFDVTILTTTSKDHMKWDDSYSSGEDSIDGLKVIRFRPRIPRLALLLKGIKLAIKLAQTFKLPTSVQTYLSQAFMVAQGPYVPELKIYLNQSNVLNIFYSYLYYPAVECSKVCSHFILIPTAHDEFALYLKGVEDLMRRASLLLLQTEAEKELIQKTFLNFGALKVGGFGFNSPEQLKFTSRPHCLPDLEDSYFFFAGRIGPGKDIPTLIEYLSKINRGRAQPYKLYLAGSLESSYVLPELPWVKYLGLVSDELKFDYISGALAVVNPSKFESLSILALEALVMGRPLIVNRDCDVLREYSTWSPLCLTFDDLESLRGSIIAASGLLNASNFKELGNNTKLEVLRRFNWDRTAKIISEFASKNEFS